VKGRVEFIRLSAAAGTYDGCLTRNANKFAPTGCSVRKAAICPFLPLFVEGLGQGEGV
jgi:hypothetical protein